MSTESQRWQLLLQDTFPQAPADLPFVTEQQMREVDRAMIEDFGVTLLQMMENAGRNLAELARLRFFDGDATGRRVLVLAGPGGNGGGGLAAARHLHNAGAEVRVLLAAAGSRMSEAAAAQLRVLRSVGVEVGEYDRVPLPAADLFVDAIFGYSMRGDPKEPAASLIHAANGHDAPVLANDIPSGIEAMSGRVGEPAVQADATMTIALPKTGLRAMGALPLVGDLYVGDISVPPELYSRSFPELGRVAPFTGGHIVRAW